MYFIFHLGLFIEDPANKQLEQLDTVNIGKRGEGGSIEMLSFLRNKVFPIGVDQGSFSLKMAQLARKGDGLELVAAACAEVPQELRSCPAALQEWSIETVKELLSSKPFKGRKVVCCLASRELLIQHLRVPKMDEQQLEKALPFEAQTKVPFNITQGRLCYVVAGEVYEGSDSKLEVILMAASAGVVARNLNLVERTKLEIESIEVEPYALVSCFSHLLERSKTEADGTMFVDLGHSCSKVVITHGRDIVFCRTLSIGAAHLLRAISEKLSVDYQKAMELLFRLDEESAQEAKSGWENTGTEKVGLKGAASSKVKRASSAEQVATLTVEEEDDPVQVDAPTAIEATLQCMGDELRGCIRYHDMMFTTQPTKRVIFVGGQSKNMFLCRRLAQKLGLPAQLADPLARVERSSLTGPHSDIKTDEPSSDWAVAIGLSMSGRET